MAGVCPNLPDELDRLDERIAAVRLTAWRASALPARIRARLIATLSKMAWQTADCRKALHESVHADGARRG